jgi:hypothetical protein
MDGSFADQLLGGDSVYVAKSKDGNWYKIGFSACPSERIAKLDREYAYHAPFKLMGKVKAPSRVEQEVHSILRPFRYERRGYSREIYPAAPSVRSFIDAFLAVPFRMPLDFDDWTEATRWARRISQHPGNRDLALALYHPVEKKISDDQVAAFRRKWAAMGGAA